MKKVLVLLVVMMLFTCVLFPASAESSKAWSGSGSEYTWGDLKLTLADNMNYVMQDDNMLVVSLCPYGTVTYNAFDLLDYGISEETLNVIEAFSAVLGEYSVEEQLIATLGEGFVEAYGFGVEYRNFNEKPCALLDISELISVESMSMSKQVMAVYGKTVVLIQVGDMNCDANSHLADAVALLSKVEGD